MNPITKIIARFKKYASRLSGGRIDSFEITPYRDWLILIIIMVVMGTVLITVAVQLFGIIDGSEITEFENVGRELFESIDEEDLGRVLDRFTEKQRVLEGLLNNPPRVVDPSL